MSTSMLSEIFASLLASTNYLSFATFVCSLFISVFIVLTKNYHGFISYDLSSGVQKVHVGSTPRVGGVAIYVSIIVSWVYAQDEVKGITGVLLASGFFAFFFGFLEDLTKKVSVRTRLLATMASGVLGWIFSGYSITHSGFITIDFLFSFPIVSVLFTAFAVGGVANSVNIIDGLNGLAASTSAWMFLGFCVIAYQVGDFSLAVVALLMCASVLGFFFVNWPLGKIFLGDGGSYFVGFSLAWVGVLLVERNSSVSPFAALLVCIYPITEVLFSVYRRKAKQLHPGHPDRQHFHSLVKARYMRRWFGRFSSTLRNSLAGILTGSLSFFVSSAAIFAYKSDALSIIFILLFVLFYILVYMRMVRHRWF